jgi:uncharacterized membrane protein YphA (DoxX/SURF4 family)
MIKNRSNSAWMEWLLRICRLILGGIFLYASIDKIIHPAQFAQIVVNFKILPRSMVNIFAITLPWVEAVTGVFLIAGFYEWASLTVVNGLTIAFMTTIAISLARGLNVTCGCFTTDPDVGKMNWLTFLRDLSFLIPGVAAYLLLFRLRRPPIFKKRSVHSQLQ